MTVLNDADAVKHGSNSVDKLYMGDTQIYPSGAPAFNPLTYITDWRAAFWASAESYVNGATVTQATDQSGNGWHATQATAANQPVFSTAAIGGQPGYVFDGVNDYLQTANFGLLTGIATWVLVAKVNVNQATNPFFNSTDANNRNALTSVQITSTVWRYRIYSGASLDVANPNADLGQHLLIPRFNTAGNSDTLTLDGTEVAFGNAGNEASNSIRMGSSAAINVFLNGAISFLGVLNRDLTTQEKTDLLAWSQSYYGTP